MLKRYPACSGFIVALLFAIGASAMADSAVPVNDQAVGISKDVPASHAESGNEQEETAVAPPATGASEGRETLSAPDGSIGTGTMAGEEAKKGISLFGGNAWDAILGIGTRPGYTGPWRDDSSK
ncbi:MAG TPA: hypothetical protein VIU29_02550 [Candidatus Deferrimicrobiaceae bacterium]